MMSLGTVVYQLYIVVMRGFIINISLKISQDIYKIREINQYTTLCKYKL